MIKFSIIVPIYNKQEYLPQCIESILHQTYTSYELILVDDGSKDKSLSICYDYAQKDERIVVVHKENGGLVSARKAGASKATGDYILNLDADDYMSHICLQTVYDIITMHKPDIVAFKCCRFREDNNFTCEFGFTLKDGLYEGNDIKQIKSSSLYDSDSPWYRFGVSPNLCFKAINASIYKKWQQSTLDSIVMGEDLSVFLPCLIESDSIYLLDETLYYYRDDNASITSVYRENEFENLETLVTYLRENINVELYNLEMQISSYVNYRVHEIALAIAKNSKDYMIFKNRISALPEKLRPILRRFEITNATGKAWLVTHTIRHNLWFLYWFMYHR